jgi:Flp pilus assembly pilin Flp
MSGFADLAFRRIAMLSLLQCIGWALRRDEDGQDLVEYALIITLVIIGVAALLPSLADVLIDVYYTRVVEAFGG